MVLWLGFTGLPIAYPALWDTDVAVKGAWSLFSWKYVHKNKYW